MCFFSFARHYIWLPQTAHLSSRTRRSCLLSSETSWTVAWKWMLRKEVEEKSCFRLERPVCTFFFFFLLFYLGTKTLTVVFCLLYLASLLEAGKATFQSHASHPGSQGGDEGQSLAWAQSHPDFPCCAQTCANPVVFFLFVFLLFSCQTIGCEWLASLDAPALKSPDKPHCEEDQKSSTTHPLSLHTNCFLFRYQKTSQTKVLSVRVECSSFVLVSWWQVRARLVFNSEWRKSLVLFSFFCFVYFFVHIFLINCLKQMQFVA